MKKILVPCDFSAPSLEAYRAAISVAKRVGSEVIVLHVIYIPVVYDSAFAGEAAFAYDPSVLNKIEEDARAHFERMNSAIGEDHPKVGFEIKYGDLTTTIRQAIDELGIDLVVMGTSGASGLQEIFIGSNTEKTVRHSPVPVLSVPAPFDAGKVTDILLPSTLPLDQTEFMHKVTELQILFGATLHILLMNTASAFRSDAEALQSIEDFARHYHLQHYKAHFRNYHKEEEGIIDFAQEVEAQLIAMGTHARKGLAHLFNGSISENVVNHIKIPVWTFTLKK